jgi:hypothetical protein
MIVQNNFTKQWDAVGPAVIRVAERVGASGRYILGREVDQFERTLAEFWGVNYAVGVGNGMDAIFLFGFDFLSVLERKNPLGLIKAFATAFSKEEGPALVIKTINGDRRTLEMEKLKYASRGRSDIILMDGYLSQIENSTVTAFSDCYVSLHRSEGFGLTIAEAMALGKPTMSIRDGMKRAIKDCAADIARRHSPIIARPVVRHRLAKIRDRQIRSGPVRSVAFRGPVGGAGRRHID